MLVRLQSRLANGIRPTLRAPSTSIALRYASSTATATATPTSTTSSSTKKLTIDRVINRDNEPSSTEDVQIKLNQLLEQELKIQQAALRRSSHLDSYITSMGYTVFQHDNSYRWIRTLDEDFHITVTSQMGLPDVIHVKIQKPGKGSNTVPAFDMELSITLNIQYVSITDPHHPHPLVFMPAPHRTLTPYSTTGNATPIASSTSIPPNSAQYQGWMCDCCGVASTSYSYHCQRGCEFDLQPSCISSIPEIQLNPQITSCSIKQVLSSQATDIPLNAFGEEVQSQFNVFLESIGIDQQLARYVWLYAHEKKFAPSTQQTSTLTKKVETLTALRNFFAQ